MKVRWTQSAVEDRDAIWRYVAAQDISAAIRLDDRFEEAADRLGDFPHLGSLGRSPGTREVLPLGNYRMIYDITDGGVRILALVHVARRWPPAGAVT